MRKILLILIIIFKFSSVSSTTYDLVEFKWENVEDNDDDKYTGYREMYLIISAKNYIVFDYGQTIGIEYKKKGLLTKWKEYSYKRYHDFYDHFNSDYKSFVLNLPINDLEKDGYDFRITVYNRSSDNKLDPVKVFTIDDEPLMDDQYFEPEEEDPLKITFNSLWWSDEVDENNNTFKSEIKLNYKITKSSLARQKDSLYSKIKLYEGTIFKQTITNSEFLFASNEIQQSFEINDISHGIYNFKLFIYRKRDNQIVGSISLSNQKLERYSEDEKYIVLENPKENSIWVKGNTMDIRWYGSFTENIKIELYSPDKLEKIITSSTTNDGLYNWKIPIDLPVEDYAMVVSSTKDHSINDDAIVKLKDPPCETPINIIVSDIRETGVIIDWSNVNGVANYNLDYRKQGTSTWRHLFPPNSYYSIIGLTCESTYEYRVGTDCGNTNSNWSTTKTFTTSTCPIQYGSLNVTISPSDAVNSGAKWNVDGGEWKSSGNTVNNLSIGSHTINFNRISSWTSPSSKTVTINTNQTTNSSST